MMMFFQRAVDSLYESWQRYLLIVKDRHVWQDSDIGSKKPKVYYGYNPLPSFNFPVSGGIVKCVELAQEIPNISKGANILYLVSSALPLHALQLIKTARKNGIKVVLNQNGVAYQAWCGSGWEKINTKLAKVLHSADYVVYQSMFCKLAADKFLGQCKAPSTILYNPVDTDIFAPVTPSTTEPLTLVIAGTHNHGYRVKLALETLAILRKRSGAYHLIMAGPFNWYRDLRRAESEVLSWMDEFNVSDAVDITGCYTNEQGRDFFHRAAVLIHTQFNDVCPRLLVESLSCGVPVVYSATGGSPEIVGKEAGIGIELPLDFQKEHYPAPEDLALGVEEIVNNYKSFSVAARIRAVENYSVVDWIDQHFKIFTDVLK